MRMIFGVMSLLIVLAIVGTLGKKQLQALGQMGTTSTRTPADSPSASVTTPNTGSRAWYTASGEPAMLLAFARLLAVAFRRTDCAESAEPAMSKMRNVPTAIGP